jgi:hypothetical protein
MSGWGTNKWKDKQLILILLKEKTTYGISKKTLNEWVRHL